MIVKRPDPMKDPAVFLLDSLFIPGSGKREKEPVLTAGDQPADCFQQCFKLFIIS